VNVIGLKFTGQTCAQLLLLGENMDRQGFTPSSGRLVTFGFKFSRNLFQVIKAEFDEGYLENFRNGVPALDPTKKVYYTFSRQYDLLKWNDRQVACRLAAAVLQDL